MSDSTSYDSWSTRFEGPPPLNSGMTVVADYLEEVFTEIRYPTAPGWAESPPTRRLMKGITESHLYPWNVVVPELRRRLVQKFKMASSTDSDVTYEGIPVLTEAFSGLSYGFAPLCPFKQKFASTSSFSKVTIESDCRSWDCEKCGKEQADRLFRAVTNVTLGTEELYVAEAQWSPKLMNMMFRRNQRVGAEYFWYRDAFDKVTFVSTRPLPGNKDPMVWRKMDRDEALTYIAAAVLWVPGHHDHGWTAGWRPLKPAKFVSDLISLHGFSEYQTALLFDTFRTEAMRLFDIEIELGTPPEERQGELAHLLIDIAAGIRSGDISAG